MAGTAWHQPGGGRELGVRGAPMVQRGLMVECKGGLAEVRSAEAEGLGAPMGSHIFLEFRSWMEGVPGKTMRTHPVQGRGSRNTCQLHAAGEGGSERREADKITLIFTKSIQVCHGASY